MSPIWNILQIEATTDKKEIKKAYARRSREIHPEERPEEFQGLYKAYQMAIQYASSGGRTAEKAESEVMEETEADLNPNSEIQSSYSAFGFDSKEMQKEQFRFEQIRYFQRLWNKRISECGLGQEFFDEEWKKYLQSEEFQEIMWSPLVMDTIATGLMKYFQWKKEVLLFFWDLYGFDIFEKWGEENFEGQSLQLLYRSLQSVTKRNLQQQKIREIERFVENWKYQMMIWTKGEEFLSKEWKEYLQSEIFREIMWSSSVLETIATGIARNLPGNEEVSLFLWDLYKFEEGGEENYQGKSLLLYKRLYPAYTNRFKRQQYQENKEKIKKENSRRVWKMVMIGVFLMALFMVMLFLTGEAALAVVAIVVVPFSLYYFFRWLISV